MKSSVLTRRSRKRAPGRPLDARERRLADLLAQRVEHERAAVVALEGEQLVRARRPRDRAALRAPLVAVRVDGLHQLLEVGVAGVVRVALGVPLEHAVLLGPDELVPARVALVEPQVAPRVRARRCRRTTCATSRAAASRPTCPAVVVVPEGVDQLERLGLQREAELGRRRRASRRGRTDSRPRAPASSPAAPGSASSSGRYFAVSGFAVTSRRNTPEWKPWLVTS